MLGEINTQILTLVMLDVFMYYTLASFYQIHLKYFNYSMYLQAKPKTMYVKVSWIHKNQMILFYTVSKQDISRV